MADYNLTITDTVAVTDTECTLRQALCLFHDAAKLLAQHGRTRVAATHGRDKLTVRGDRDGY